MHAKVIQVSENRPVTSGFEPGYTLEIDSLGLECYTDYYYKKYGRPIVDYVVDSEFDENEYMYDVKGFAKYLKNYASFYSEKTKDNHDFIFFTVNEEQKSNFLKNEEYMGLLDSPPIYISRRVSTGYGIVMESLYEFYQNTIKCGERYYIGSVNDVHN